MTSGKKKTRQKKPGEFGRNFAGNIRRRGFDRNFPERGQPLFGMALNQIIRKLS